MHQSTPRPDASFTNFEKLDSRPAKTFSPRTSALVLALASSALIATEATQKPRGGHSTNPPFVTPLSTTHQAARTPGPSAPTDAKCADCHTMDPIFSHPVDVQVVSSVSDPLALDQGILTCTTCHKDADYQTHDVAIQTNDPMLRLPAQDLCAACHVNNGATPKGAHASIRQRAHAQTLQSKGATTVSLETDAETSNNQCLVCHDGMISSDAGAGIQLSGAMFSSGHPVEMQYPSDNAARRLSLRQRVTRDPRIRLWDGELRCESCHSLYSSNPSLLVIDNDESRLCMACHNL